MPIASANQPAALDRATLLALRDMVSVQERVSLTRVMLGDHQVMRFVGCGNQYANTLMAQLRAALTELAAAMPPATAASTEGGTARSA